MKKFLVFLRSLVNMSDHLDYDGATLYIRKNVSFKGPNVIILTCAVFTAALGLNINSIPVIIGAMLISPLMGPILGFGFGLATRDNALVKEGVKNLIIMVSVSIVASTIYFLVTPLKLEHPTELLARTIPTIYDVLIALFGGIAGMIEISRKERGTVIAGVAISTTLLPPLCTIGYGFTLWKWSYIIGAFYLFTINIIFIALATYLVAKYLRYPVIEEDVQDESATKRSSMKPSTVAIILLIITIPSIFTALRTIKESNFKMRVSKLITENKTLTGTFIYEHKVDFSSKPTKVELFMAGDKLDDVDKEKLYSDAEKHGIARSQLVFREDATVSREGMSESELIKDIYERSDLQLRALTDSIGTLNTRLEKYRREELPSAAVSKELSAQYPEITKLVLTKGSAIDVASESSEEQIVAIVSSETEFDAETTERIRRWLSARLERRNVVVLQDAKQLN